MGDEVSDIADRKIIIDHQHQRNPRDARDRRDTPGEIIGSEGSNDALIALAVLVSSRVYPSGGALMTAWVPILLPAPGLFSTKNAWPSRSDRRWQISRDSTSVAPPAVYGTTHRTGRDGMIRRAPGPSSLREQRHGRRLQKGPSAIVILSGELRSAVIR